MNDFFTIFLSCVTSLFLFLVFTNNLDMYQVNTVLFILSVLGACLVPAVVTFRILRRETEPLEE